MLNKDFKIINGNSLEVLDTLEANSVDAIVTDPPYGLTSITKRFGKEGSAPAQYGTDGSFARLSKGFMGKEWDGSGIEYNVELWSKALKVLKPGGYLLAFGGTRTYHRIACAIEDAGFEIRDCIMWLYGSGFPKSMNIGKVVEGKLVLGSGNVKDIKKLDGIKTSTTGGWVGNELKQGKRQVNYEQTKTIVNYTTEEGKKWDGWGTQLKPAYEPIIMARKPVEKTIVDNVLKYGVGGINIDACRVGDETIKGGTMPDFRDIGKKSKEAIGIDKLSFGQVRNAERKPLDDHTGRFPANVIHDGSEEAISGMPNTTGNNPTELGNSGFWFDEEKRSDKQMAPGYDDEGSAARYFYCAKASSKDRDEGLESFETQTTGELQGGRKEGSAGSIMLNADGTIRVNSYAGTGAPKKNIHPTVKPTELMQYLVRLVAPKGATILDIFNGSGSTGKAVAYENRERDAGYKYIGIELDPEYCKISEARIDYVLNKNEKDLIEEIKENEKKGQLSLFDFEEED